MFLGTRFGSLELKIGSLESAKLNYHRVPRIREIGSLQVYTGYLTVSLKKTVLIGSYSVNLFRKIIFFVFHPSVRSLTYILNNFSEL